MIKSPTLTKKAEAARPPSLASALKSFLILCPTATRSSGVLEAMYALYYLPPTYRLRVEGQSDLIAEEMYQLFQDDTLAARIDWNADPDRTEMPVAASPFSVADVVVYGKARPTTIDAPSHSLIVFNLSDTEPTAEEAHRFTITSNSPEALASAILQVTR